MHRSALVPVVLTGLLAAALTPSPAAGQTPNGSALFDEHCASCHFGDVVPRALAISTMRSLAPEAVVTALTTGAMREQGAELRAAEHRAVAEFVTGRAIAAGGTDPEAGRCATTDAWPGLGSGPEWNGWGAAYGIVDSRRPNRRVSPPMRSPASPSRGRSDSRTRRRRRPSRPSSVADCLSGASAGRSTRSTRRPGAPIGRMRPRAASAAP